MFYAIINNNNPPCLNKVLLCEAEMCLSCYADITIANLSQVKANVNATLWLRIPQLLTHLLFN